jgi:hypothetical protein
MSFLQCLTGFNKSWEQTRNDSGCMTLQIELIKAHVLDRPADAADPLMQVIFENGTGLKEFESATLGDSAGTALSSGPPRGSGRAE